MTQSKWIQHVKAYQQENHCSYKEALKGAKASYVKPQKGAGRKNKIALGILGGLAAYDIATAYYVQKRFKKDFNEWYRNQK